MNSTPWKVGILIIAGLLLAIAGGYYLGQRVTQPLAHAPANEERQILYWYDPMVPGQHFDQPGKSPFMDMELVPRYAGETDAEAAGVHIDPGVLQNLGVRYTNVERASWQQSLDAVGSVVFDERRVAIVQTRAPGFITRVYARAPGDVLREGAPLVDLLVPEWAAAQSEFIAVLKTHDPGLSAAARERLTVLGMPAELITHLESARVVQTSVTIRSPIAGAIESLDARAGMSLGAGATIAKITGIATVWLEAAVPEAEAALAQAGRDVEVQLTAYPGEHFEGRVIAVLPEANAETRTLRVRVELDNKGDRFKPGMYGRIHLLSEHQESVLQVASEAIIRTGTRSIVLVAHDEGRFEPVEVRLGATAHGRSVILDGLHEGQKVVSSGQFLIDSEANLQGVLARLEAGTPPAPPMDHSQHMMDHAP